MAERGIKMREVTNVLGIDIDIVNNSEALKKLNGFLREGRSRRARIVVTPNPEMIMLARRSEEYKKILQSAALSVPDGTGVVLASRMTKRPIAERVPGIDLITDLLKDMAGTEYSAYFLGAAPGVAEKAKERIAGRFSGIKIVGAHDGYFDSEEDKIISEEICRLKPDVLLVGISMGKAERWAFAHRDLPVNIIACVGGTLDVLAGQAKRAPGILRRLGLEWLYRLIKQPKRILRMAVLPKFAVLSAVSVIKSGKN